MSRKTRQQAQRQRTQRQQKRNSRRRKPQPRPPRLRAVAAQDRPAAATAPPEDGLQRWSRLLTKADKEPTTVLEDPRCLKPHFVARFFDLCDGKALEAPWVAGDYAEVALELAAMTGVRHQMNIAQGIAVHADISNTRWAEAAERLSQYQQQAFDCCTVCTSDWLKRQGDLLVETLDPALSSTFLKLATRVLGDDMDDDSRGRILFVRGIAHLYLGDRDRALSDSGETLELLSLSSPQGYFMDVIGMVGCFIKGSGERRHYELALAHLIAFRDGRLKGHTGKNWLEVRDRLRWVMAQIEAWLGHPRRARACLERIRAKHIRHSPHRYALAIAVDEALVYCLHLPDVHIRSIRGILAACKRDLRLEPEIRRNLRSAATMLGKQPWRVREILASLRQSYIVPVPGLLTDRVMAAAAVEGKIS